MDSLVNDIITCNLSIRDIAGDNTKINQTHSIVAKRIKQFQIRGLSTKKYLWYSINGLNTVKIGVLCNEYISSIDMYEFVTDNNTIRKVSWDMFEPYIELENGHLVPHEYGHPIIQQAAFASIRRCQGHIMNGGFFAPVISDARNDEKLNVVHVLEEVGLEFPIGNIIMHLMNNSRSKSYFILNYYYGMCELLTLLAGKGYWNYWTRNMIGNQLGSYQRNDTISLATYSPYICITIKFSIDGTIQSFIIRTSFYQDDTNINVVYDATYQTYVDYDTHKEIIDTSITGATTMLMLLESVGLKRTGICI